MTTQQDLKKFSMITDDMCRFEQRGWGGYLIDVMIPGAYTTFRVQSYTSCIMKYPGIVFVPESVRCVLAKNKMSGVE
jgi:hypothetical protein